MATMTTETTSSSLVTPTPTAWMPIAALAAGIAVLVTSEFLPAGVLPTIAADIGVSDGAAGLAVAFTAIAGALTAPTIPVVLPRADRRRVLVSLLAAGAVADLTVLVAPDFPVLLAGRLVLGVAIAGFWSFAFGAGVHALPGRDNVVSTSLALGVSVATVLGVPLAAVVDDRLGWRPVFGGAALACALVAVGLARALPPVPAHPSAGLRMMRGAVANRRLLAGVVLTGLVVCGNFAAYPYIRLAIERISPSGTTVLLVAWGVGGMVGNLLAGALASRLRLLVTCAPVLLGVSLLLTATARSNALGMAAIALWGFAFNMVPVATQLWVTRIEPERAESAVSLNVMGFQLAIMIGSAAGGALLDAQGVRLPFVAGAAAAAVSGLGFGLIRLARS
jgi:predicted MFS family arabinose efflux permease